MSLTLHLDLTSWRAHLDNTIAAMPTLVPVAKGNGYGFGLPRLARETTRLGAEVLAVGTADEVAVVRAGTQTPADRPMPGWEGDIVVLTPWSRHDPIATALLDDPRVISTISRRDDLRSVAREHPHARVLLEALTSMKRHGLTHRDLADLPDVGQLAVEGWTIHLPMRGDTLAEARALAKVCLAALPAPLWLSHLSPQQMATLAREVDVETRLRLGTSLWLGAPGSRRVTSRVLDMHPVRRGERVGYWQRPMPSDGWVVVLSGGTAHGVAMAAPTAASSWANAPGPWSPGRWTPPAGPCRRTRWPGASASSSNLPTCSPRWCSCRAPGRSRSATRCRSRCG